MQRTQTGLVPLCCWQPAHSIDTNIVGLICSLGCSQRKTTNIYCPIIEGATHSTFSDTLQHSRQLQQQISGVQQQGLVASQRCKNLAARCFKGETGNDVRKHMIRSRLSNVSDAHVLAEAGIDARAPFFSCQISRLSLRFCSITDYLRSLFLRVWVSDYWWCPSIPIAYGSQYFHVVWCPLTWPSVGHVTGDMKRRESNETRSLTLCTDSPWIALQNM